eukprot:112005_1
MFSPCIARKVVTGKEEKAKEEKEKILSEDEFEIADLSHSRNPNFQLFAAAKTGDTDTIRELHKDGVDINIKFCDFEKLPESVRQPCTMETPLHTAAEYRKPEAVFVLIELGADIESRNKLLSTPLHKASCVGCVECMEILLDAGADLQAINMIGNTPLHCAAYAGHVEACRLLLDRSDVPQCDIVRWNFAKRSPMNYAQNAHRQEVLETLKSYA